MNKKTYQLQLSHSFYSLTAIRESKLLLLDVIMNRSHGFIYLHRYAERLLQVTLVSTFLFFHVKNILVHFGLLMLLKLIGLMQYRTHICAIHLYCSFGNAVDLFCWVFKGFIHI
jgi:hypothetical protein